MGSVSTSSRVVWLSLYFLGGNEWVRSPRHLVCGSTRPCWVSCDPWCGKGSAPGCARCIAWLRLSTAPSLACSCTWRPKLSSDVDVTDFVRFELDHQDIGYGVLDLIVTFVYPGRRERCYLLHFFPVDAVKENVHTPFPEWTEGFEFPPALLKLRAVIDDAIIPLYHQGCIAINTRGATIYGTKRTRLRRVILHIARTGWGPSEACAQQGEVDPRGSGGTLISSYSAGELLKAPVPNEP